MKKILMFVCSMSLILGMLMLTGCSGGVKSSQTNSPQSVSLVLGTHANFPGINLTSNSIYSKIYDTCYTYGNLSAVCVDGDPYVVCNYQISAPDKNVDTAKKKQLASNNAKQIVAAVSSAVAKTPEVDTLTAISLSADALHSATTESQKTMIVIDSGLGTTGLLNMAEKNIIDTPVEDIVSQLEELHAIPDLSDVSVTWIGLGAACGEQDKLTSSYKHKLENLWNGILTAGGADVVFDSSPLTDVEYAGELPECSVVPVIADSLETVSTSSMPEVIKFDEETSVKFKGNKAEFIDSAAATKALSPIAEYLIQNPKKQIYIAGMTATVGGVNDGKKLSLERANAVKQVLVGMGVNEEQLLPLGLGHTPNALRVQDTDQAGNLVEEKAKLNRAVFFVQSDSELVATLLQSGLQGKIKNPLIRNKVV